MLLDTKVLYLTHKKAIFQGAKGHSSVINRRCTMPFGVYHPLNIQYLYSYQFSMKSAKALPRYGYGQTDGKTDGKMDGQRQNNIPPPMAGDNNGRQNFSIK
ncbi:hypothetical protein DPMN_085345 [Dreissena polymorpha]|uniref:Uncharacterized protein n=1 Tax=Dreissena polymorpha TaxID=45954 RepID=A0A9D3YCK5_DREPO|nr:hypothetical protein DPMN_085345 [Dreissena polymorpha]